MEDIQTNIKCSQVQVTTGQQSLIHKTKSKRRFLVAIPLLVINILFLVYIFKCLRTYSPTPAPQPVHRVQPIVIDLPPCEPNISVYDIDGFVNLTTNIQIFLLYRHCRHFPMLLDSPHKCDRPKKNNTPILLLAIKSFPSYYRRREVLRKTWASDRFQNGMLIRTVFLTGTTGDGFEKQRLNTLLAEESDKYQDILQWDFTDTFYNLTLKQVLLMQWLERSCPTAVFIFNGDDDIFANSENMVEYVLSNKINDSSHLFIGSLMVGSVTVRDRNSKYYVPVQIEPAEYYPPYCSGGGFLYSRFTARTIHEMSKNISLIPIDDAYMGMCLQKAGLSPMGHMGVWPLGVSIPSDKLESLDPCYYREIILVHKFMPQQIYMMWHEIHRKDLICGEQKALKRK